MPTAVFPALLLLNSLKMEASQWMTELLPDILEAIKALRHHHIATKLVLHRYYLQSTILERLLIPVLKL